MKLSYFAQPVTMPERTMKEAVDWNLQVIRWLDELGFDEFWMGEHFTDVWEPIPAPELVLAQALLETERIKLGPAGHCLAYHHPIALAHRVAMMDHMAQGRYQFGVASGAIPSDLGFYGIDAAAGQHRDMVAEALQIILRIWTTEEPFEFKGKYWTVNYPAPMFDGHLQVHIKPFQKPHMPIALTGFSPSSGTLKFAGKMGYIPMSLNLSNAFVKTHWEAISQGAAEGGRTAQRSEWRILKETLVAETDAEARRLALNGPMARAMREYFLPLLKTIGMLPFLKHDPEIADDDVTVEYLVDNSWLVGSPSTVQEKLEAMYEDVGGFGHLMFFAFDYSQNPEVWRESLGLFTEEVLPKVAHLDPT